jgi:fluoroquinolone transport system permease protein
MKRLITTILWDLRLELQYQIVTVAALITTLYVLIFLNIPGAYDQILIILIFSDPALLGFMFIGGLVLFEKGAGTLQALVVTPLRVWQYLWAKTISLTLIALPCSLLMTWAGHGWQLHYPYFILGVILTSSLFVLVGFAGVSRVKTLNQYLIIVPMFLTPFFLPLLNFFGITNTLWLYLIPSQASLILLEAGFSMEIAKGEIFYSIVYLLLCVGVAYYFAHASYIKYVIHNPS